MSRTYEDTDAVIGRFIDGVNDSWPCTFENMTHIDKRGSMHDRRVLRVEMIITNLHCQ